MTSPHCIHCIEYAPVFQTTYEYYYTSHPEDAPDASFLEYYDFRFGSVNCVAYGDLCSENGVVTFPVTKILENGEDLDTLRAVKTMEELSSSIEAALEKAKPGSRPKTIVLPEAGDNVLPKSAPDAKSDDTQKKLGEDELPAKKSSNKNKESGKESSDKGADKPNKSNNPPGRVFDKNWKSPTPAEVFNNKRPKKPIMTPNQNGVSISLTAESFQRMVTLTQDPWFIKFYAPWCHHCQAMGPTWDQLAKTMRGKLNVGEVNCDKESRLCKDVGAKSYPTILFFKGGERAEYRGLRGLGDFVQYADSALDLASGVPDVNAEELAALEEKEDVIFVYFYDHATTSEDFMALERIPLSLIGHAKLVKTNDEALYERFKIHTFPRLLVSREGRPTYYTPITPDAIRDVRGVLNWMRSVWLPLVPELTASNARQIMDGKVVVLGILNREEPDSFQRALKEMKTAANEWMDRQIQEFQLERKKLRDAKQMRVEEARDRDDERALRAAKAIRIDMDQSGRKEVGFAWVDGVFWQRWIRTTFGIDVSNGERVIINDQDVSPPASKKFRWSCHANLVDRAASTGTRPSPETTSWSAGRPSRSLWTKSSTDPTRSRTSSPPRSFSSSCMTWASPLSTTRS